MLIAGCQSKNSTSATSMVSSSQIAIGRKPESNPRWRETCQASAPAAARMASGSTHDGHGARKTNCPREKIVVGYLKRSSNIGLGPEATQLVRHRIKNVVDPQAVGLRRRFFRVFRRVRPLPGVAVVLIEAHGHHDAAVIIVNSLPLRHDTIFLI